MRRAVAARRLGGPQGHFCLDTSSGLTRQTRRSAQNGLHRQAYTARRQLRRRAELRIGSRVKTVKSAHTHLRGARRSSADAHVLNRKFWMCQGVRIIACAIFALLVAFLPMTPKSVHAHSGNTDSNGCHTCRTNCPSYGLDYGEYHCHNPKSNSYVQPIDPIATLPPHEFTTYSTLPKYEEMPRVQQMPTPPTYYQTTNREDPEDDSWAPVGVVAAIVGGLWFLVKSKV